MTDRVHDSNPRFYDPSTGKWYYYVPGDAEYEVVDIIRNQVVNPDTLEWVNQSQSSAVGGEEEVAVTNWPTTQPVSGSVGVIGSLIGVAYDSIVLGYTDGDLTTVTYKTGGVSGATVATLTLSYTAHVLQNVVRT